MAYSYGLYISPITLTDLTVTIEYDNQELPSQTLTLNDFSVDGDELYSGIRVLSDCSMTIESQGYQTQTYNIVIANIESEMHITLTPAIKYFSKISDGTNTYFVKDTEAREKAEIFIASYNTTEFNDIQSAYQNGKNVILVWDEAIFPLLRISDTLAEFGNIYNHDTNAKFLDFVTCNNQNVWTRDLMSVLDRSLSNLDATGQAVIDGKVSKSGDTMTGDLTLYNAQYVTQNDAIDTTTTPSSTVGYDPIVFKDANGKSTGGISVKRYSNGGHATSLYSKADGANTWANFEIGFNSSNTAYCNFPNTTCVDSKVYNTSNILLTNGNLSVAEHSYSLSSYLPDDGKIYEIFLEIRGRTGTASGNYALIYADGGITGCNLVYTTTRSSNYQTFCGYGSVYVSSARNLKIKLTGNAITNTTIAIRGYRRIGTNE